MAANHTIHSLPLRENKTLYQQAKIFDYHRFIFD